MPPHEGQLESPRPQRVVAASDLKTNTGAVGSPEALIARASSSSAPEEKSPDSSLADLIAEALDRNPEVRAAHERWLAARSRIEAATSLEDPVFSYTNFLKNVETRVGPQRNRLGISQKFPFFGKLSLKGEIASRNANEAEQFYETLKLEIIAEVKSAYYRLFLIYKSIDVTQENVAILRRFAEVANVKYATGKASQQDVLKAQVRLSRLADHLITLKQEKETAEAALNVLLDRAPEAPLARPADIERRELKLKRDELRQLALEQHPVLLGRKEAIEKSSAALALAKRQYYPDLTLGVDYIDVGSGTTISPEDGKDAVSVTFRVNIPLWFGRLKSEVDAARAAVRASEASYETAENRILFDIHDSLIKVETAERLGDLFTNTLLPQAEQTLQASLVGYEADKVDFLNLLDSQKALQDFQLDYYRVLVDFEQRLADLERAVGVELPRQ